MDLQTEFNRYKNRITKIVDDLSNRVHKYLGSEDHIDPSLLTPSAMKLMEVYIPLCKRNFKITSYKQLIIITLACFWIADKFHNDLVLTATDIKDISGGEDKKLIIKEETKILLVFNFNVWRYMIE